MKNELKRKFVRKSILAGILIGLGGFSNLSVENRYVGAFIFSIGLISVILLRCNLYTGKIGYVRRITQVPGVVIMCALNILGAGLLGLATSCVVSSASREIMIRKIDRPLTQTFIMACVCGALIYLAVELFRTERNILLIIIPVFTFVATGADHCIANAYYFAAGTIFSAKAFVYMLVCILGNATGSLIISLLQVERGHQ